MFHVPDGKDIHGLSILEISRHPEVHRILEEVLTFDFSEQPYSKESSSTRTVGFASMPCACATKTVVFLARSWFSMI